MPAYYSQEYFAATYEKDVFPISHEGDWELPIDAQVIKPPIHKRQAGRPKEKRYRSKHEKFHPYTIIDVANVARLVITKGVA